MRREIKAQAALLLIGVLGAMAPGVAVGREVELVAGGEVDKASGIKATEAKVHEPFSVEFDAEGNLYGVEFTRTNRVFKISRDGSYSIVAGKRAATSNKDGDVAGRDRAPADEVRFNGMHDLAITPEGAIYLADTFNLRLWKFDVEKGLVETVLGTGEPGYSGDGGPAEKARVSGVYSCALNRDGTRLYVTDLGNRRVRVMDLKAGTIDTVAGNGEKGQPADGSVAKEAPLAGPRAVAVDDDENVYIVSREGHALRVVGADGKIRTVVNAAGTKGNSPDDTDALECRLAGPKHACVDGDGNVIVADTENHCIRRYVPGEEKVEVIAGVPGKKGATIGRVATETELNRPHGVRLHGGWLYIADSVNDRVLRVRYGK